MISKMKRTTSKENEEPTPPLYSLPIKNTTFPSRPIVSICHFEKRKMGKSLHNRLKYHRGVVDS